MLLRPWRRGFQTFLCSYKPGLYCHSDLYSRREKIHIGKWGKKRNPLRQSVGVKAWHSYRVSLLISSSSVAGEASRLCSEAGPAGPTVWGVLDLAWPADAPPGLRTPLPVPCEGGDSQDLEFRTRPGFFWGRRPREVEDEVRVLIGTCRGQMEPAPPCLLHPRARAGLRQDHGVKIPPQPRVDRPDVTSERCTQARSGAYIC